jgi:hypothetical protein
MNETKLNPVNDFLFMKYMGEEGNEEQNVCMSQYANGSIYFHADLFSRSRISSFAHSHIPTFPHFQSV